MGKDERIVINVEEAEEQERELERAITIFIGRWVSKVVFSMIGIAGIAIIVDKLDTPEPDEPPIGWKRLDLSRDVHEVKNWDMITHEVEYYEYNPSSSFKTIKSEPPRVEIRINNSQKVILEGVTQEEVLESFDIDYEDIRDYYGGDELR